jgi:adenylate cyclase
VADVFVSYVSADRAIAEKISRGLEEAGLSVWWDRHLQGGVDFGPEIERQLDAAKAVVVLWSVASRESKWVRDEAQQARDDNKLIPVRLDKSQPPLGFRQAQSLDFDGWNGAPTSSDFVRLLHSIRHFVGATAGSSAPPLPRKNSICVLPFVNMSGDAEQEYFSDGISEDIITDLSKISALFVIARNTAFTFKAKSVDVSQIVRQLNISHVLEGSVRKAGDRVRITAQLIDGATGGHMWAERYDRDLTDIFAVQDEIAQAIVTALKLRLLPEEQSNIERRGTINLDAYDLYLRGTRPAFAPDDLQARIVQLEAATELAPDYADAWGALAHARSNWRLYRPQAERDEIAQHIAAEAEQALALDPQNAAAMWAQLNLLPPFGRFVEWEALIDRMRALRDARSVYLRSAHLLNVGRMREAIEVAQRAYEMNPLDHGVANWHGLTLLYGGRYGEARRSLESTLAHWPDSQFVASNLNAVCVQTQDWAAVDALLAPERLAQFPLREYERRALGFASVMRDPSPGSRRRPIEAARRLFGASGYADFMQLQMVAKVGALDEAHAIAARARFGPAGNDRDLVGTDAYRPGILFMGMFPEFRRDPRFVKLCARLGLVDYWLKTQHWPDCADEVAPYYDFKAECEKVAAGPPLPPANEAGTPAAV